MIAPANDAGAAQNAAANNAPRIVRSGALVIGRFQAMGCPCEVLIGDPMSAVHQCRQETARQFVLALGAGLECFQALAQTIFDSLVVAGLKMKTWQGFACAPVTAIKRIPAAQAHGSGRMSRRKR